MKISTNHNNFIHIPHDSYRRNCLWNTQITLSLCCHLQTQLKITQGVSHDPKDDLQDTKEQQQNNNQKTPHTKPNKPTNTQGYKQLKK